MLFAQGGDEHGGVNWSTVLASFLASLSTFIIGILTAYGIFKGKKAEARKLEAEADAAESKAKSEINAAEAKAKGEEEEANTRRRREDESLAVSEAMDVIKNLKKQYHGVWESERQCRVRLATYVVRDRVRVQQIKDLQRVIKDFQKKMGVEVTDFGLVDPLDDLDTWADETLKGKDNAGVKEHPRAGD